jgi:ABC-type ATPase involved in cell division
MHHISVRHFGPVISADVQVNNFTVIIGEHAMGKSTIAMLVYFFRSLHEDLVLLGRADTQEIDGKKVSNSIRDKFYLYFGSSRLFDEQCSIVYEFGDGKKITLKESPLRVVFEPQEWYHDIIGKIRDASVFIGRYREKLDFDSAAREENMLKNRLITLFNDRAQPKFIPDGRNITVKFQDVLLQLFADKLVLPVAPNVDDEGNLVRRNDAKKIGRYLMRDFIFHVEELKKAFTGRSFKDMLQDVPRILKDQLIEKIEALIKARYGNNINNGVEYLQLIGSKTRIPLESASSGQQESIRIAQDIAICIAEGQPVFRVIEEPEAHLFPTGQKVLIELLVALLNDSGLISKDTTDTTELNSSVFITTHSPYILTILNNLILAGDLGAKENGNGVLNDIIAPAFRLRPEQLSAYMINGHGECLPINDTAKGVTGDENTGLIGENILEDVFGDLQSQFDELIEIGDQV